MADSVAAVNNGGLRIARGSVTGTRGWGVMLPVFDLVKFREGRGKGAGVRLPV